MTVSGKRARILVVDDEEPIRKLLVRVLGQAGHEAVQAGDVAEADELLARTEFDLALCDVNMPRNSGLELVRSIYARHPATATVMVTGVDDPTFATVALESGAYGYILKPFRANEILIGVANALRRRELELESREHRRTLERAVRDRTLALRGAMERLDRSVGYLRRTREEAIDRLCRALEYHDGTLAGHDDRVAELSALLAVHFGLDQHSMKLASRMHDLGKVSVPDAILAKPGPLTADERRQMEAHTVVGHELLTGSGTHLLELAATIALTHHERFDGGGYPRGLRREEIPFEARCVAVADVFDALTSDRPYRRAYALPEALEMMNAERGTQFDPEVLDALLASMDDLAAIVGRAAEPAGALVA